MAGVSSAFADSTDNRPVSTPSDSVQWAGRSTMTAGVKRLSVAADFPLTSRALPPVSEGGLNIAAQTTAMISPIDSTCRRA
jgi:hypothetical protein